MQLAQRETYQAYEYFVTEVDKFPFANWQRNARSVSVDDLPLFSYGWSDRQYTHSTNSAERTNKADQLIVSLNVFSLIELAKLYLDIGNQHNVLDEICLENPVYGFGGTDKRSINITFHLPGSIQFYHDDINALRF